MDTYIWVIHIGNHTGYRQFRGSKLTAEEITDLWEGLKQSHLDGFDMMLSGYVPGAAGVEAVGRIAKELKENAASRPGSFFWVLGAIRRKFRGRWKCRKERSVMLLFRRLRGL